MSRPVSSLAVAHTADASIPNNGWSQRPCPTQYEGAVPLRCRGAFHLYAARCRVARERRLLVVPAPHANHAAACARLERFAAAHRRVQSAAFPRVCEADTSGRGDAFVAFAIAPACDGEHVVARLRQRRERVSYAQALGLVEHLGQALDEAHAVYDARGAPLAFGGMGWANVIFSDDGMPYLIGLGHNVVGRDEEGALSGVPSFLAPPELTHAGLPTPSADTYAFVMLQRSLLSCCALPSALTRVFAGEAAQGDVELSEIVRFSTEHVLAAAPARRASIGALRSRWLRESRCLGLTLDLPGLRATLAQIIASAPELGPRAEPATGEPLVIGAESSWLRAPDGSSHRLDGRGPLKRILQRLAREHALGEGGRLDADALLEAGWPGQRVSRSAGLNRVYVAIALLRKMGLRDALQRDDLGYRLDPGLTVRIARPATHAD